MTSICPEARRLAGVPCIDDIFWSPPASRLRAVFTPCPRGRPTRPPAARRVGNRSAGTAWHPSSTGNGWADSRPGMDGTAPTAGGRLRQRTRHRRRRAPAKAGPCRPRRGCAHLAAVLADPANLRRAGAPVIMDAPDTVFAVRTDTGRVYRAQATAIEESRTVRSYRHPLYALLDHLEAIRRLVNATGTDYRPAGRRHGRTGRSERDTALASRCTGARALTYRCRSDASPHGTDAVVSGLAPRRPTSPRAPMETIVN
jgi:hypothetical protein